MKDRFLCKICNDGKIYYGLMSFANHTARKHHISATRYWEQYGFEDKLDKSYIDYDEKEVVIFT